MYAVPEMEKVKIFAKARDRIDGGIGQIFALGEYQVAQARRDFNDLLYSSVCQFRARCEI